MNERTMEQLMKLLKEQGATLTLRWENGMYTAAVTVQANGSAMTTHGSGYSVGYAVDKALERAA